ncbi:MAG TPA: carboxypeptidase regulatory-like domain-containing protein, partial [Candidatus Acidoferrales bacterium]|nr:carboxypeptidase regulatory-like domain-containing protein [Candidatus Acidoferrales bacterium]
MNNRRTIRQVVVALVLLIAFAGQETWALAGTTGGLSGQVTADNGAPVAGAAVKVSSPSQTATATTDASGHFAFLSLAPDTYAVTASKDGFVQTSYAGVTIFADQSMTLQLQLQKALKNIANVTSRAASSLVKAGTTADVYSVNAATQTAVQGIGGGYNLDSAYSAIYSQPGVTSQIGNYGFGQVYYIRGSSYTQVGYEYDGVPVNRAFDNYNANSLSNVGAQETEVYTGGSPAGGASATLAGYINQVIKTGTFPGYANLNGGAGYPAFYHKAGVEAGGATPDRLFSYYVGIQGSNETYNTIDDCNGCGIPITGAGSNGLVSGFFNATVALLSDYNNGTYSTCPANGSAPTTGQNFEGIPACNIYTPWSGAGFLAVPSMTQDRENVLNFHFGIPHHNDSGKDDVQLLYYNFAYHQYFGDSIADEGGPQYINSGFAGWGGTSSGIGTELARDFGVVGPHGRFFYPGDSGPTPNTCAYQALFADLGILVPGATGCATSGGSTLSYV